MLDLLILGSLPLFAGRVAGYKKDAGDGPHWDRRPLRRHGP